MTKNKTLLLIFSKRALFIFIFSLIVVHFLTIVSKTAFASPFAFSSISLSLNFNVEDTISSLMMDGFESENLSEWEQTEDWEVSSENKISGEYSLKHLAKPVSGKSSLFHSLNADWNTCNLEWTFTIKNGNWDPSGSNKWWFYLSADHTIPELINGWAVGVNIVGNGDLLELWRIREGKADSMIIQSVLDWNASTQATIHVKRSSKGKWELTYQKSGESVSPVFSGNDIQTTSFSNIGLCFIYTYTRSGQLWVDDIYINTIQAGLSIQKLIVINSHTLTITFNQPFNPASVQNDHFLLTDENNVPIPILTIQPYNGSNQTLELQLGQVAGSQLTLQVSGLSDLSGNMMKPDTRSFAFSFVPEPGTILINEVLFNPLTGGSDFVELVNHSQVPIDLRHLKLASRNDGIEVKQIDNICSSTRFLQPGQYLTCTKDSLAVVQFYLSNDPLSFCSMKAFPTYPDNEGTVVLLNDSLEVIDEFSYNDQMHSPFLVSKNGVSLERISLEKPTGDRTNWTSATSSAGYATPGLPNSQITANTDLPEEIVPDPIVFSPNGDGYNDQLTIRYSLSKAGYQANVRIFDIAGRIIKYLVRNESIAQQGSWVWKGDSDSGQRLSLGVYIILVELFDPQGHNKTFRKTCTLSDRIK